MADDIIGTPVERVIPEGWHGVYVDTVSDFDLVAYRGKWCKILGHDFVGQLTDTACEASGFFVIRRNAPVEPSVEEMKDDIEMWSRTAHKWHQSTLDLSKERNALKAKVSALDAEIERLRADTAKVDTLKGANIRLEAKVSALEAEKAKFGETCHDYFVEEEKLRAKVSELEDTLEVVRSDLRNFTKWHADAAAKLSAVKKAWEGA